MKKQITKVVCVAIVAMACSSAMAVDFEWFNQTDGNGNGIAATNRLGTVVTSDGTGSTPANGALFQLIRSVNAVNEAPDLAELGTGNGVNNASDDQVVWTLWAGGGFLDAGNIYENQTIAALLLTDNVYIRIWEDPSPGATFPPSAGAIVPGGDTAYWDTAPVLVSTLPSSGPGLRTDAFAPSTSGPILAYDGASHSGAWVVIPEPSVLAFLGIGGLVVAVRRRMQKA